MKKTITALLTLSLLCTSVPAMAGANQIQAPKLDAKKMLASQADQNVKFTVLPNLRTLKAEVQAKLTGISKQRGFFYMSNIGSNGFVFQIAAGEKPNPGYGIKVQSIKHSGGKMKIVVQETLPKAGMMYTDQLAYPTVVFKAALVSEVVEVQNTKGQKFKLIMPDKTPAPVAPTTSSTSSKETIHINPVASLMAPKLLVPEGSYSKDLSMTELAAYFGRDPMPAVPEGFKADTDKVTIQFKADGSIFYMSGYNYSKDMNDPNTSTINIQLNKGALPLRDCFYTSSPNESVIGNTQLVIGSAEMKDDPAGASYQIYTSQFIYNGIGYDITARRVDEQSFLKLLHSIIK